MAGKTFLDYLTKLSSNTFAFNGEVFDFFTIKNFSLCVKNLVVFIEYTDSSKILKCTNEEEFIFLLKKMETAHSVFIFEQEILCL
jgi:hypothetical protein|tara:strand:- start:918 stop:1172 length:255 start_codon:yes stop_codon:yes gene_type:complete